MFTSTKVLL